MRARRARVAHAETRAMAVWQYDLLLVPEGSTAPTPPDKEWEAPRLPAASTAGAQRILAASLGAPWLMMEDWVVFGNELATRVDFLFDASVNVEILVRIDASATDAELDTLCAFAGELRCRFFDPATRAPIQPDRTSLATALARSRAASFARSPRPFPRERRNA